MRLILRVTIPLAIVIGGSGGAAGPATSRTVYATLLREATAGAIPRATLLTSCDRILLLKSGM